MWCPNCKNEYIEGITHCPDCDVDLVEELWDEDLRPENMEEDPNAMMPELTEEEAEELREEIEAMKKEAAERPARYKSPADRYNELKSSAFAFLIVGVVGLAAAILSFAGILHFPFNDFTLYVMAVIFVIFLIIGVFTIRSANAVKGTIAGEEDLVAKMIKWFHEEGKDDEALTSIDDSVAEEQLYFQRSAAVKKLLTEKFPEADKALVEKLTDDFCEELF